MKSNVYETERLIDRYFDGDTTLDEERLLRTLLADVSVKSDKIDEARAVLGYITVVPERPRTFRRVFKLRRLSVAATVAAIGIFIGLALFHRQSVPDDASSEYIAYIGGQVVNDKDEVMEKMLQELAVIRAASEAMNEDVEQYFSDMTNILNEMYKL